MVTEKIAAEINRKNGEHENKETEVKEKVIIEDIKADLSEAAQDKLKAMIGKTIETKLQKEAKKLTRRLTIKFILTGVALAGVYVVVNHSGKIIDYMIKSKVQKG